ncbi:hypothetical protein FA15DRAFT_659607 [Coprinopsis marcescibilis]|uniref:Uncharacterized protein n=1 Tax=Coprinopsis marcescibilis TaxID=230819 RepID=A0A5C3KV44_COPMA|nr:hypothetical protein FA15DRAFT_659607 [Coprinopsis marcescibilis]
MSNTTHPTRQASPSADAKESHRDTDIMQKFYDNLKAELDVPGGDYSMDIILEEIRSDPAYNIQLTSEDEVEWQAMLAMNVADHAGDRTSTPHHDAAHPPSNANAWTAINK